jgi:hypothetical protein
MRTRIILTALTAATLSAAVHADFVITSPPPAPDTFASEAPLKTPAPTNHRPPRFEMAYGFGDQIPLSFAVRQIVPPTVKVTTDPAPTQMSSSTGKAVRPGTASCLAR